MKQRTPVDFSLMQVGRRRSISLSDFRGGWVVINYWATWCAPCRKEMPELSALHDERDDLTVLGLAFEDTGRQLLLKNSCLNFMPATRSFGWTCISRQSRLAPPGFFPQPLSWTGKGRAVKAFLGPVTREAIEELTSIQWPVVTPRPLNESLLPPIPGFRQGAGCLVS